MKKENIIKALNTVGSFKPSEVNIINTVMHNPGITQTQIAKKLNIHQPAVSMSITPLVKQGYLTCKVAHHNETGAPPNHYYIKPENTQKILQTMKQDVDEINRAYEKVITNLANSG